MPAAAATSLKEHGEPNEGGVGMKRVVLALLSAGIVAFGWGAADASNPFPALDLPEAGKVSTVGHGGRVRQPFSRAGPRPRSGQGGLPHARPLWQ
jgi:hypothetical protein